VVVSTPQDIALIDARKGIDMFNKMNIPVLGIIENMAAFVCTDCGATHHPFGHGGARSEAGRLGVPFLGEVPLELGVREAGDAGTPVVLSAPDSAAARAFSEIAESLIESGAVREGA
jgi:ATP-binding protein involved in chromosome partitioning